MIQPEFKIVFRKGKFKVREVKGDEITILEKIQRSSTKLAKLFKNILMEVYIRDRDKALSALKKILTILENSCKSEKINDAYILLEEDRKNVDLYLSFLGKKITIAVNEEYLSFLEKIFCQIFKALDIEFGSTLKIKNYMDHESLNELFEELSRLDKKLYDFSIIGNINKIQNLVFFLKNSSRIVATRIERGELNRIRISRKKGSLELTISVDSILKSEMLSKLAMLNNIGFFEAIGFKVGEIEQLLEVLVGDKELDVLVAEFGKHIRFRIESGNKLVEISAPREKFDYALESLRYTIKNFYKIGPYSKIILNENNEIKFLTPITGSSKSFSSIEELKKYFEH